MAFLPPNTTSHLQPLDAGIIASFKNHYKRNFCRHMLNLFEDGKDIHKEKINIKEAIDYLVDAWKQVTEETIHNCWKKTGILPSSTDEDIGNATQIQQNSADHEEVKINQIIEEIEKLNDDPYNALLKNALTDYFQELEEVPTEDILNDDDIIQLVQKEIHEDDDTNDDSEEEPMLISPNEALKSLQTWITFFDQQPIDEFNIEDGYVFKKYLNLVRRLEVQSRKQAPITDFFSSYEN